MKKIITGSMVFLSAVALFAGCTNQQKVSVVDTATQAQTQINTQATEEITQEVQTQKFTDVNYVKPILLNTDKIISKEMSDQIVNIYNVAMGITDDANKYKWDGLKDYYTFYKVGTLNGETYKGWNLLILSLGCNDMCFSDNIYRFVQNPVDGSLVYLTKYSELDSQSAVVIDQRVAALALRQDKFISLPSLDLPVTLPIPNSKQVLTLKVADGIFMQDEKSAYKHKLFESAIGTVYGLAQEDGQTAGCVQITKPDGTVATYGFEPGFDTKNMKITYADQTVKAFDNSYVGTNTGCGIGNNCYFTRNVDEKNLVAYATLSNGLKLYRPIKTVEDAKDADYVGKDDITLVSSNYQIYLNVYQYGDKSKPKATFAQYVASTPVLFWQDPFNRWSAVVSSEYEAPGECGKPVIYLYPEKDMDVKVKVGIETMTKSIPDYNDGWSVLAHVGGEITNYADGNNYPYLFWEGQSSKAIGTDSGFVVARADLDGFLHTTLTKAGLNNQETKDFVEFWYPRMMANQEPYFVIKFLGTTDFNKIAPLTITPKPDTLARVFMYYQPSNSKVTLRAPVINGFERRGFTVVEWGGTSNTPWVY